jgi:thioredoxin-related protein
LFINSIRIVQMVLLICIIACRNNDTYQPVTKFDPNRDAAEDIAAAVKEAGRSGKNVILDVGGEWCIWCRRLDQFFEQNRDISDYMLKNYVVVKVNWSKENKNEAVLSSYPKIPGYPHLFVLDARGNLLHSQDTGLLESGDHHDRDKIMEFLRQWTPHQ